MALKVWLPLDGDLRNLGASDVTITNNGATVNNSGKIGKCYSPATITITNINNLSFDNSSYCFWAKTNSTSSWQMIIGIDNSSNSQIHGIYVADSARYKLEYNPSLNIYNAEIGSWHHYAFIIKNGESRCYYDGVLQRTSSEAVTNDTIGRLRLGVGTSIFLNDVRIYDHCLSAAEVREIAMGLVLHYKLDGTNVKTGTNLISNIRTGNRTTKLTDGKNGVITNGTQEDTYFWADLNETITSGTTYKLSFNASGITEGARWIFSLENQSDASYYLYIYNGYNEYTFTAGSINWRTNTLLIDEKEQLDYANPATFWDFQLYKLSNTTIEVKDSSGYGHNGTINGVLTTSTNTSRYNNSCIFNGTDNAIQIPFNDIIKDQNYTISVWTYKTSIGSKSYQTILGGPSGFELEARNSGGTDPQFVGWNWGKPTATYEFNKWTLFTFVHTPSNSKLYVNGELKATGNAATIPTGNYYIGAWNTVTQQNYEGQMSDFRIYCTPLLGNDIKMLYNVGMKVDNLEGIHSFEFKEAGGRELLGGVPFTTSYSNHENIYTNYTNGEIKLTGSSSISTPYIEINPTGKTYYWDAIITKDASNVFYLGFERYDANKTARSNNATTYVIGGDSAAWTKKHVSGTVNLSTDGVNACKYITLRILNDWSSANNRTAIIHQLSLREISTAQKQSLNKNGILLLDELKEDSKAAFYKNGFIESTEFIEL